MMDQFNDVLRQARHGKALEDLAAEYGIASADFDKLLAMVLPLFSLSLQAKMTDPAAMSRFFDMAKTMQSLSPTGAGFGAQIPPQLQEMSRQMMDQLTGSAQASAAAFEKMQAMSGVPKDAVAKAVPSIVGAWASLLANGAQSKPDFSPQGMMEAWQKLWGLGAISKVDLATGNPFADAYLNALKPFLPGGKGLGDVTPTSDDVLEHWRKLFASGVEIQESQRKAWEEFMAQLSAPRG